MKTRTWGTVGTQRISGRPMTRAQAPKWERYLRSKRSEEVILQLVRREDHEMRKERWAEDHQVQVSQGKVSGKNL